MLTQEEYRIKLEEERKANAKPCSEIRPIKVKLDKMEKIEIWDSWTYYGQLRVRDPRVNKANTDTNFDAICNSEGVVISISQVKETGVRGEYTHKLRK